MREVVQDLWKAHDDGHWVCVTTNAVITKYNECVMGGGCAKEAAERFPELPKLLAAKIKENGNRVYLFLEQRIITFPTKENWWELSSPTLIEYSLNDLKRKMEILPSLVGEDVYLPRPGVGLGGLRWENVKPLVLKYFSDSDRLVVVTNTSIP